MKFFKFTDPRPDKFARNTLILVVLTASFLGSFAQSPAIFGGHSIDITEAPYQVSIERNGNHSCGGVILSTEWILTAGHCLQNVDTIVLTVHAGSTDQTNDSVGQRIVVDTFIVHPDFTLTHGITYATHDIALLHLSTPLRFNKRIRPVEYAVIAPGPDPGEFDEIAFLSGWGNTGSGCCTDTLMGASLPAISDSEANTLMAATNCPNQDIDETMIAFFEEGIAAGMGDSGGPAVITIDSCGHKLVIGVSSWGGCPIDSLPTIYADVRALSEFIEEFVPHYLHADCYDVEITENTTWTADDIPSSRLGEVRVLSGTTFEISQDAVLEFCEDGMLIVEPNAHLKLNGTLTNACGEAYWQGIKVYGDSTENQFFDFGAGVYHHGLFNAYPGSVVENAITGVELWGPTNADSGGKIFCDSTVFRNNKIGVFFRPYRNIYGGQPRPYRAGFTNCTFTVDDHFPHAQFYQHAALFDVDGIRFTGCDFLNEISSPDNDYQYDFGYGIAAVNAGFMVHADFASSGDVCSPPCLDIKRSQFRGLGYGIYTSSFAANRLFRVYQSDFEDCYTSIEVDGVSAGVMLFNNFIMGNVADAAIMDSAQVGIKLNQQLAGFTVEENVFSASSGNVKYTIGIAAENLGEFNNVIRRDTFSGLTIANEAFGKNGAIGLVKDGLRYACLINASTEDKDFFVPDTFYGIDNLSALQLDFAEDGSALATGNQFSSTGNQNDGDFANYGEVIEEYIYYPADNSQVPDAIAGIANDIQGLQNACAQSFCAPPCLSSNDLSDLSDYYFEMLSDYEDFIDQSQWPKAAASKVLMDRTSLLTLQHVLADTTNFNPDSLKIWYSRIRTVSGDILLAKDYAANGNYSKAREVLDSIVFWHGLVSPTQYGISDMDTIFGILDVRGVDELTSGDINTLLAVSNNYSHAAAMARGILILEGYRFQTQYVIPSSDGEERIALPRPITAALEEITVYPNPNNGDELNITVPDVFKYQNVSVDFWTLTGTKISSFILSEQYNRFRLPKHPAGLYLFRICGDGTMLKTGRFAILK